MKKAMCVGINNYVGSVNDLQGCVNDANDWDNLLRSFGFETEVILDAQATKANIINKFDNLVTSAQAGDVIVFTYSGHGTSVMDTSGDEPDGYDEALYVYDGVLLDDALRASIQNLKSGVHLTVISDSCFSGTVTRLMAESDTRGKTRYVETDRVPPGTKRVRAFLAEEDMAEVLVSGCADDEYSYDAYINGRWNGAMSANAIDIIEAKPDQTYNEFYDLLRDMLPSREYPQTPQLEGSAVNKRRNLFEPFSDTEPEPGPGPEPEPEPQPDNGSWLSKYWWVILLVVVVVILLLLLT